MMERQARVRDIECFIKKWRIFRHPFYVNQVGKAFLLGCFPSLFQRLFRHIKRNDGTDVRRECAADCTSAGSDVEHGIIWPRPYEGKVEPQVFSFGKNVHHFSNIRSLFLQGRAILQLFFFHKHALLLKICIIIIIF